MDVNSTELSEYAANAMLATHITFINELANVADLVGSDIDNDCRVVSNFIVQALQGKDIMIYGDGQQTRSFCYVDDLIDAMVKMMNTDAGFTGLVNIGSPGEFTMLQLAETILKLSSSKSKIIHQPLPSDDPWQRQPNIELAKTKFG